MPYHTTVWPQRVLSDRGNQEGLRTHEYALHRLNART
jgi:hypothetical protein